MLAGDAIAYRLAALVDGQHVAFGQAVTAPLVEGHHVVQADLGHAARHVEDQAVDGAQRLAGHEGGGEGAFLGGEQAVGDADLLGGTGQAQGGDIALLDRKSTRLNSSHVKISYAVFCLKKKKKLSTTTLAHSTDRRN